MSSKKDMIAAVKGAHTVFLVTNFWESMSAAPEILQGKIVTDACKEQGVQHLIFSSLIDAAEATNGRLTHITHFDGKAEVERYIRASGLQATFVMMGIFTSQLFDLIRKQEDGSFALATPTSTQALAPFVDVNVDSGKSFSMKRYSLRVLMSLGNFVRAALQNQPQAGTAANTIYASSDYYSFDNIATHFEKATGKTLKIVSVPGDVFKGFLSASLPPDMVEEVYENLILLEDPGYYAGADLTPSLQLVSEKPMGLEEFFRRNKAHW